MAPLIFEKEGMSIVIFGREHLPPHIHASYGDNEALINIRNGEIIAGSIPSKKLRLVRRWLNEGKNRAIIEENFYELNPRLRPNVLKKKDEKNGNKKNKG